MDYFILLETIEIRPNEPHNQAFFPVHFNNSLLTYYELLIAVIDS